MITAHRLYPDEVLADLDLDPSLPVTFADDFGGGASYRQGETGPWSPAYPAVDYEYDGDVARAFLLDLAELAAVRCGRTLADYSVEIPADVLARLLAEIRDES